MDLRINVITLGVKNIERSKKFYEDLEVFPTCWAPRNIKGLRWGLTFHCKR